MIKLYVQNKPLFLADKMNMEAEVYLQRRTTISIDEVTESAVKTLLHELQQPDYYAGVLAHPNTKEALRLIKEELLVIQAAGGLVKTKGDEYLLIYRRGKWDLPKGKLDEGEDLETCAVREVTEETGLSYLTIVEPLHITYHTYFEEEQHILKETHWYLMSTDKAIALQPQAEEDIEKCEWVTADKLPEYLPNMHPSIFDVLQKELPNLS